MVLVAAGIAAAGFLIIAVGVAVAAPKCKRSTKGISPEIVRLAKKWAAIRGIPVEWVLATIKIESGGDVCKVGKAGEIGLMQVYPKPNVALLKELGVSAQGLFNADKNLKVGTALLKQRWEQVHAATGGSSSVPVGTLVALAYWGPGPTLKAIREGTDPRLENPQRVANWNAALQATAPLV